MESEQLAKLQRTVVSEIRDCLLPLLPGEIELNRLLDDLYGAIHASSEVFEAARTKMMGYVGEYSGPKRELYKLVIARCPHLRPEREGARSWPAIN